jgi:hypothetical protein
MCDSLLKGFKAGKMGAVAKLSNRALLKARSPDDGNDQRETFRRRRQSSSACSKKSDAARVGCRASMLAVGDMPLSGHLSSRQGCLWLGDLFALQVALTCAVKQQGVRKNLAGFRSNVFSDVYPSVPKIGTGPSLGLIVTITAVGNMNVYGRRAAGRASTDRNESGKSNKGG